MKKFSIAYLLVVIVLFLSGSSGFADITIVLNKNMQNDKGWNIAASEIKKALDENHVSAKVIYKGSGDKLPAGEAIIAGDGTCGLKSGWQSAIPESYKISTQDVGSGKVLLIEGDIRGVMYGMFKLAEKIRLGENLWGMDMKLSPAFPVRMFSEEGQLLDIPDIGYYTDKPPFVNEKILRAETDELKILIDSIARLGYNSFTLLNMSLEEFINYKYLDSPVYEKNDPHLKRTPIFCKYLKELCDYAHARHMDFYLQLYEMQFPPKLDELYGITLDSPSLQTVIDAKTREFFENVPADGLVITANETAPRCGYFSRMVWQSGGKPGAGKMLTMFHNSCKKLGKKSIFRMWRVAYDAEGVNETIKGVPSDAMIAIKNTGGDYFLSYPLTDALTGNIPARQPTMVLFDSFREYDGWSRLFCYMKRWGDIMKTCRNNGVVAINVWGAWAPGCIWPNWDPVRMEKDDGSVQTEQVSWIGHWNQFRMFTRGFTPGQSNAYLAARLMWEPDTDVNGIARDFAALFTGNGNSDAAAKAILATEDAFAELYPGTRQEIAHPTHLKWTMVFGPKAEHMEKAYKNLPLQKLLESNRRGMSKVDEMERAFAETDESKSTNLLNYGVFKEGVAKTALWLKTVYLWRECWWRNRAMADLSGDNMESNRAALKKAKADCMILLDEWSRYPEEAGYWHITYRYGKPVISPGDTYPKWFPKTADTLENTLKSFKCEK